MCAYAIEEKSREKKRKSESQKRANERRGAESRKILSKSGRGKKNVMFDLP